MIYANLDFGASAWKVESTRRIGFDEILREVLFFRGKTFWGRVIKGRKSKCENWTKFVPQRTGRKSVVCPNKYLSDIPSTLCWNGGKENHFPEKPRQKKNFFYSQPLSLSEQQIQSKVPRRSSPSKCVQGNCIVESGKIDQGKKRKENRKYQPLPPQPTSLPGNSPKSNHNSRPKTVHFRKSPWSIRRRRRRPAKNKQ